MSRFRRHAIRQDSASRRPSLFSVEPQPELTQKKPRYLVEARGQQGVVRLVRLMPATSIYSSRQYIRGRPGRSMLAQRSVQNFQVIGRHLAALMVGNELELEFLSLAQLIDSGAFHCADMDEGILAAIIWGDEAEALL
jgi:hypothetical protein